MFSWIPRMPRMGALPLPHPHISRFPRLSYSVSQEFSLAFTLVTIALSAVVIGVLIVVNYAANGYETLSISSSDFNYTQTFWYDIFPIARSTTPLCQPFTYHIGDSFRTSTKIFTWEVSNVIEAVSEDGTPQNGSIFDSMPYSNVPLDYCDVFMISVTADLFEYTVTLQAFLICLPPIPFEARTIFTSSPLNGRDTRAWVALDTQYGNTAPLGQQPSALENVTAAVDVLAFDILETMYIMYLESAGGTPVIIDAVYFFDTAGSLSWCPPVTIGQPDGCDAKLQEGIPAAEVDNDFIVFQNLTIEDEALPAPLTVESSAFKNPFTNTIRAMHAAARADLGTYRANNMFQNVSVIPQAINASVVYQLPDGTVLPVDIPLGGAQNLLGGGQLSFSALPLPMSNASVIQTEYLCNRQYLKGWLSRFFSVSSGTISTFLAIWGVYMFVCTWWTKRKLQKEAKKADVERDAPLEAPAAEDIPLMLRQSSEEPSMTLLEEVARANPNLILEPESSGTSLSTYVRTPFSREDTSATGEGGDRD